MVQCTTGTELRGAVVPSSITRNSSQKDGGSTPELTMSPTSRPLFKDTTSALYVSNRNVLPACVLSFQENKTLCCLPALSKHYIITLNKALQSGKRRRCLLLSLKPQLHLFMFCKCLNSDSFANEDACGTGGSEKA